MGLQPPTSATPVEDLVDEHADEHADEYEARRSVMVDALVEAMESLPANPTAAMQVMWLADGAKTDANALASAIELDPGLTARVLRLANSAFYSPYGSVSSVSRAVVNVGFSTVKALATAALTGLDDAPELPVDFWEHAAKVAHAASQVARHFGAPGKDAFALGLLHDVGEGLLCTIDTESWRTIEATTASKTNERFSAEVAAFGMTHAEVAGRVLDAWKLPRELVRTIYDHHRAPSSDREMTPLALSLAAGEAIAELYCDDPDPARASKLRFELERSGLAPDFLDRIGPRLAAETATLTEALAGE